MHQAIPQYGVGERLADGHIHVLGVTASIVGATALLVMASSLPAMSILSLTIYSIGLVAVFSFSAAYNLVSSPLLKAILRRFDHAAIYLKIAATYTPFALIKMSVWPGLGLLALVWVVAAFGLTTKLLFPGRLVRTSYVLYLALGWAVIIALDPLAAAVSDRALLLLGAGGALYTIGVVFHLWHRLRYHNAIWHAFVLCASSCHYAAVVDAIFISRHSL